MTTPTWWGSYFPRLDTLQDVADLQREVGDVYLRYSRGHDVDMAELSLDKESGCVLPGLSVNPLRPEVWWTRPAREWMARQLCQYVHLAERENHRGWVLTGTVVGRGPDCEPLVAEVVPLAVITPDCLAEAEALYRVAFAVGRS